MLITFLCSQSAPHYKYSWDVKDDYYYVNMNQQEDRYNDNTKGSYSVDLPDGRRQTVTYYVDDYSGYVADVKYDGYAKYSAPQQSYQQSYQQPSYNNYNNNYKSSY